MSGWKSALLLAFLIWLTPIARGQANAKNESRAEMKNAAPQTAAAPSDSNADATDGEDAGPPANADPAIGPEIHSDLWRYLTSYEFALAVLVLLFGVLVVVSASVTLRGRNVTPDQALRFYGVIVILVGTILLIVAGLNNNQIAPAVGLFGTLAGYLLGKTQTTEPKQGTRAGEDRDEETNKS